MVLPRKAQIKHIHVHVYMYACKLCRLNLSWSFLSKLIWVFKVVRACDLLWFGVLMGRFGEV